MKFTKSKFTLVEMLIMVAVVAILAAIALPALVREAKADPQISIYQSAKFTAATNLPTIVNTTAASNTTSIVTIPKGKGISFLWKFNATGTSNACTQIAPSPDGTNYDTTPWQMNRNANGTTTVIGTTNWSAAQLAGYQTLKIVAQTNQNAGTLTNQLVGWGIDLP